MTVALLAMIALAILVIAIFRLAMKRVWKEREKLRQSELEHQQKLLFNSLAAQERERRRIAADLHDELTSRLNIIRLSLFTAPPANHDQNTTVKQLLDETIELSRNISHDLYPPLLAELGLIETIKDYLHPIKANVQTTFYCREESAVLNEEQALQLFRVFQELVQNVLKHAEATELKVLMRLGTQTAFLSVQDNGKGFEATNTKTGLGMGNVESRIHLLQGKFKVKTRLHHGTSVKVLIPIA